MYRNNSFNTFNIIISLSRYAYFHWNKLKAFYVYPLLMLVYNIFALLHNFVQHLLLWNNNRYVYLMLLNFQIQQLFYIILILLYNFVQHLISWQKNFQVLLIHMSFQVRQLVNNILWLPIYFFNNFCKSFALLKFHFS